MRLAHLPVHALMVTVVACSLDWSYPAGGSPSGSCRAGMVHVGEASVPFCIDATETTVAQYDAFLATIDQAPIEPPVGCEWRGKARSQYLPANFDAQLAGDQRLPVVGVDWCQAYAYCERAGKRLCGKPGGGLLDDPASTQAEWYIACSHNGTLETPVGNYLPGMCSECFEAVDGGSCQVGPSPVGSHPECVGGYDGIFDLAGNVWEWIAYCDDAGTLLGTPEQDECRRRGGSFEEKDKSCLRCTGGQPYPCLGIATRKSQSHATGIRCCASPN